LVSTGFISATNWYSLNGHAFEVLVLIKTVPLAWTFVILNDPLNVSAGYLFLFRKLCSFISTQSFSLNSTGLTLELKYFVGSLMDLSLFLLAIF
jgi:hypothetical protein